jgi:hypothetical protein
MIPVAPLHGTGTAPAYSLEASSEKGCSSAESATPIAERLVRLTPRGEKLSIKLHPKAIELQEQVLDVLDPGERDVLLDLLVRVIEANRALELERSGHCFATHTDTEVIVHLTRSSETTACDDCGACSRFALWDRRRSRLLLAHDRVGKKPLFYADLGGAPWSSGPSREWSCRTPRSRARQIRARSTPSCSSRTCRTQ